MAERKPVVPENQLLDLIQNPSKAQDLAQKQARQRTVRGLFSLSAWKGRALFLSAQMSGSRKSLFGLRDINRFLVFLIVVLFIYLVVFFVFEMRNAEIVPVFKVGAQKSFTGADGSAETFGDMEDYTQKPRARDIFRFGDAVKPSAAVEAALVEEDEFEPQETGPLDRLSLVGIGFSDDPDAMVQDIDTEEVFFLKRGDMIQGDIKVEDIFRDRVILSYKGKEIELR